MVDFLQDSRSFGVDRHREVNDFKLQVRLGGRRTVVTLWYGTISITPDNTIFCSYAGVLDDWTPLMKSVQKMKQCRFDFQQLVHVTSRVSNLPFRTSDGARGTLWIFRFDDDEDVYSAESIEGVMKAVRHVLSLIEDTSTVSIPFLGMNKFQDPQPFVDGLCAALGAADTSRSLKRINVFAKQHPNNIKFWDYTYQRIRELANTSPGGRVQISLFRMPSGDGESNAELCRVPSGVYSGKDLLPCAYHNLGMLYLRPYIRVMRMQSKMDEQHYAVKQLLVAPAAYPRSRKEVLVFARLSAKQHPNIAAYVGTLPSKHVPDQRFVVDDDDDDETEESTTAAASTLNAFHVADSNSGFTFAADTAETTQTTGVVDRRPLETNSGFTFEAATGAATPTMTETVTQAATTTTGDDDDDDSDDDEGPQRVLVTLLMLHYPLGDLGKLFALRANNPTDDTVVSILKSPLHFFTQMCDGLEYMHGEGLVHRDLKPANIFVGYDHTFKIGDFGLATEVADVDRSSAGTPLYMAPEQVEGRSSPKSDIYSLGLILLEWCLDWRSEMQRHMELDSCRKGTLPQSVHDNYASVVPIIERCVTTEDARRPLVELRSIAVHAIDAVPATHKPGDGPDA